MYRVDRNNFYKRQKAATIYTPEALSKYIFSIVDGRIDRSRPVLDPCVGAGSLLKPFAQAGYRVVGVDIEDQEYPGTLVRNYLAIGQGELEEPSLVIVNPPFNIDAKTKEFIRQNYSGRPLLPEIWLSKALELFGNGVPIVLFAPYGLRLNQMRSSRRWRKFASGEYPEIRSIIALPKDVFDGILFHSEILLFNMDGLKGHYFYNS